MRLLSALSGLLLLLVGTFSVGLWVGHKGTWPMSLVLEIKPYLKSLKNTGMLLREYSYFRRGEGVPDQRHTVYDTELLSEGYLFVARIALPEHMTVAELIDPSGRVIHEWRISYRELIDPNVPEVPAHDVILLPDASVVANFDSRPGLVRLDACGDPVWSRSDAYLHHSLAPDEIGGIWTWESQGSASAQNQRLVRFDEETGETLESIDLIEDIIMTNDRGHLRFVLPEDFRFKENTGEGRDDIFHPNDLEPLPSEMASAFPEFETGDLLVSLRNNNMLAVIGRNDHSIKWSAYGPWWRQHDPDFQPDGTITVFSNNSERQRSEVLRLVPGAENGVSVVPANTPFFSALMSKHEMTQNGNLLVISTWGGRVMEFAPDGQLVREYVNILDEGFSGQVSAAQVVVPGFLTSKFPLCADAARKTDR